MDIPGNNPSGVQVFENIALLMINIETILQSFDYI